MDYGLLKKYTKDFNVLFVEDDIDFRKEFFELLQDIFPKVTIAVDGLDALNKYKEFYTFLITLVTIPQIKKSLSSVTLIGL